MKAKLIRAIPWTIIVILIAFHLFRSKPIPNTKESEATIKEIKSDRDSLLIVIDLKDDTIQAVRHRMNSLEFQLGKADKQAQILKKKYESIRFVNYANDSARYNAVAKLYPSMGRR
jgi:hypothetical protein